MGTGTKFRKGSEIRASPHFAATRHGGLHAGMKAGMAG
jgi:hypothetical protein